MTSPYALVDCQNFYVSCERVFDPALRGRPVAVLSNNDGCVIARSEEVKELGIPMAAPYFTWRKRLEREGAAVLSSNYELYADMSRRVMRLLGRYGTKQEVYSIDESFLRLPALPPPELEELGRKVRRDTRRWVGLPVRIGIGHSKTLAKIANHKARASGGVFALPKEGDRADAALASVPVGEVWGIGRAYREKLKGYGVHTARALRDVPLTWAKRHLTATGRRTVLELRGKPCMPLELAPEPRRSITRSRSFGERVEDIKSLNEAIAKHAARAAKKLRSEKLVARGMQVFTTTRHYGKGPHRSGSTSCELPRPTNHSPELIRAAGELLRRIYRPGYGYKKAGVVLFDLTAEQPRQAHLFSEPDPADEKLMQAVDEINQVMGKQSVIFGAEGTGKKTWHMQRQRKSPCYTTRWAELPAVN